MLLSLLRWKVVCFVLFTFGQVGVCSVPKPRGPLDSFFDDTNTKIPGPAEAGCTAVGFNAFVFDLPVSFLALAHVC